MVELESNPGDLELLNKIFRVAHTIKGSGSFLNFDVLTHLTHHMEDVLNKARHGDLSLTPDIMDVVLESIDLMKALLAAIRDTGSDANTGLELEGVVQRLDAISNGGAAPAAAAPAAPAPEAAAPAPAPEPAPAPAAEEPEPDYANMSAEEVEAEIERLLKKRQEEDKAKREAKRAAGTLEEVQLPTAPTDEAPAAAPAAKPAAPAAPAAAKPAAPAAKPAAAKPAPRAGGGADQKAPATAMEQTIRVDVKRLDHLMTLIGELVLGKNRLLKIYNDVEERYEGEKFLEELNQVVSAVSVVTTDLQLAVM